MRKVILGLAVFFLFGSSPVFSNPYPVPQQTLINEIQSSPDSLEAIELHWAPPPPDIQDIDLGGWFVTTSAGTAYVNPGVILPDSGYVVINSGNTTGGFSLNDSFETIKISPPDESFLPDSLSIFFLLDSFSIFLPPEGKSPALCNEFVPDPGDTEYFDQILYFYWDSSPTMGYENNDQHSWGTIEGEVWDRDNQPICGALIKAFQQNSINAVEPNSAYSNSEGQFQLDDLIPGPYMLIAQVDTFSDTIWVNLFSDETIEVNFTFPQYLPKRLLLFPNCPNPFNSSTEIRYFLPKAGLVRLTVYNILGQRVVTLFAGFQEAGYKSLSWKPRELSSGIYFCRIQTQRGEATKRMILLR